MKHLGNVYEIADPEDVLWETDADMRIYDAVILLSQYGYHILDNRDRCPVKFNLLPCNQMHPIIKEGKVRGNLVREGNKKAYLITLSPCLDDCLSNLNFEL